MNISSQVLCEELDREKCYEMVTNIGAPFRCGCVAVSDDYRKKVQSCNEDCKDDTADKQCCVPKCTVKNILVDGKVNFEALASTYKNNNSVALAASKADCEPLGEKNLPTFSIENIILINSPRKTLG